MDEKSERLGAHEVAAFLRRHPKFLAQFPDLAVSLVVPKEEGQAASLASYQLDVLRDKNRELTRRLNELYANAQENERLAVRTHQLSLALMRANGPAETLRTMVAVLGEDFRGELVRVVLFEAVPGLEADWLQVVAQGDAALAPFRDFMAAGEPLTGRLNQDKLALLFGPRAAEAASAVLLPLPGVGMLAVGSSDANRFFPGMGTLFLRLMSEALVTALGRAPRD
ncbi:MAG: hypothetical protein ABS41_09240 [Arenimonas sp. SCN 70-307]|uniref:DUF484 family protein n=1 Tax=Arenimonas sp. SCN 70-307 TaxID=1660089 RepID=UPI00086E81C7|nr:DUF484 family protein [Arenimonas sp. SCN 70-307]ODS62674.1 MAG: hypothetical protein ABS41_09240 [Arenimonas sp. SCN 70-307]